MQNKKELLAVGKELLAMRCLIGRNIYEIRLHKKMTLKKLARRADVCRDRLDQYEIGKSDIGLEAIIRIANSMGVSLNDLMSCKHMT